MDWYRAWLSAALDMDRPQVASDATQQMLTDHPDDPIAWRLAAQFAAAAGDYRAAAINLAVTTLLSGWVTAPLNFPPTTFPRSLRIYRASPDGPRLST